MRTKGDRTQEASMSDQYQRVGSTAATIVVTGEGKNKVTDIHIASVGDSRVVLSRNGDAIQLTTDHKASVPEETDRIRDAGGVVDRQGRLNGTLALSRAFGDIMHKGYEIEKIDKAGADGETSDDETFAQGPLSPIPTYQHVRIQSNDEFVILFSDGLADCLNNQQIVNFIRRQLNESADADLAARMLVKKAIELGAVDNLTCVVVTLHN